MKRIVLFLATNLAVVLVLSVVLRVLGLDRMMASQSGVGMGPLLAFSFVVGFTGAIISLLMSKPMAKWSTGAHVIDTPQNAHEAWLVETVRRLATTAGTTPSSTAAGRPSTSDSSGAVGSCGSRWGTRGWASRRSIAAASSSPASSGRSPTARFRARGSGCG